jgi:hypothetical protein
MFTLSISLLQSCGPSRAEIETQLLRSQFVTDSISAGEQKERERQALLKHEYMQLKAELAGAETKLQSIQEFKLLRTQSEKAQQVTEQVLVIEELKNRMEELAAEMR